MRRVSCISAVAIAWALASPATGDEVASGNQFGQDCYGAQACGAPSYGLTPGCCEHPPNCCSNAWDGYCEQRARTMAFFQCLDQFGKRMAYGRRPCRACPAAVAGDSCPSGCKADGDSDYYATPKQQPSPVAAPAAVPAAQPLTPAIGRRLGYSRPPITAQH